MGSERRVLEVNGQTIRNGTSLFDAQAEEVMWYAGVRDGYVQLDKVDTQIEMPIGAFKTHILTGDILVEASPPGHSK